MTYPLFSSPKKEHSSKKTKGITSCIFMLLSALSTSLHALPVSIDNNLSRHVQTPLFNQTPVERYTDAFVLKDRYSADAFKDIDARFSSGQFSDIIKYAKQVISKNNKSSLAYEVLGAAYLLSGKLDLAQQALETSANLDKRQSGPLTKLGVLYMDKGEIDKAKNALSKAIALNIDDRFAHQRLGLLYEYEKNFGKAAYHLGHGIKNTPKSYIGVTINLGLSLNALGRYNDTIVILGERLPISANNATAHAVLASAMLAIGNHQDAKQRFERILTLNPDAISARLGLARIMRNNSPKLALKEFESIVQNQPTLISALLGLGETHLALNQTSNARSVFNTAIKHGARSYAIERRFAKYYMSQNKLGKAELILTKLRDSKTPDEETYIMLSELYQAQKKFRESADILITGSKKHPNSALLKFRLGSLYAALGRYKSATIELRQADKISPDDPNIIKTLSLALAKDGNSSESMQQAEKLYQLLPKRDDIAVYYAIRLVANNERTKGKQIYYEVLKSSPNNITALNNLANLLLTEKKYKEAEQHAKQANNISQNNAVLLDTLAWVYYNQGRYKKALSVLDRASNLNPNLGVIWYHKGKVLHALEMIDNATNALSKAVSIDPRASWVADAKSLIQ